jgi:hypothetical protein
MQAVTTIGLDIAKSLFQIHGLDAAGNVIVRRQRRNSAACVDMDTGSLNLLTFHAMKQAGKL